MTKDLLQSSREQRDIQWGRETDKHVQMAMQQACSEEIQFLGTGNSLGSIAHP